MNIVNERPPNWEAVLARFPAAATIHGVVFAWGNTLYNPTGIEVDSVLHAHEATHGKRQLALDGGPEEWWQKYLTDPKFCFDEELLAHQAEWAEFLKEEATRKSYNYALDRQRFLAFIARRLSGPLYGYAVSFEKARRLIRWSEQAA